MVVWIAGQGRHGIVRRPAWSSSVTLSHRANEPDTEALRVCNHCIIMGRMPVIHRFANCRVRINPKDHPPPHFHVQLNDGREAWVSILSIEIIHGRVATREIAEVLAWAKERQAWLAQIFEELQR